MSKIAYKLLTEDIAVDSFRCDNTSIENQLKDAYYATLLKQGNCYEIIVRNTVVGYFFSTFCTFPYNPQDDCYSTTIMDTLFPAVHIRFIAINNKYKGHKLGQVILRLYISIMRRSLPNYEQNLPVRFLIIDALKELYGYYLSVGFHAMDEDDMNNNEPVIRMIIDLISDSDYKKLQEYIDKQIQS